MNKNLYKIIYIHGKILFPHGTIQVHAQPSRGIPLKVGETVLVFPIRSFLAPLFYRKRLVTVAKVLKEINSAGVPMVELKGLGRARLDSRKQIYQGSYVRVFLPKIRDAENYAERIRKKAQEFVFLIDIPESDRLIYLMTFITQLNELIDFISHYFITNSKQKWRLYTELDLRKKSELLIDILDSLISDVHKRLEGTS